MAKHRGVWPMRWMCEMLEVSRGGFYEWLRARRASRGRENRAADGQFARALSRAIGPTAARGCGGICAPGVIPAVIHRVARLMRGGPAGPPQAATAAVDLGVRAGARDRPERAGSAVPGDGTEPDAGSPTSRTSGPRRAGCTWPWCSICSPAAWWAGR